MGSRNQQLWRLKKVAEHTGLSEKAIKEMVKRGMFPQPVAVTSHCIRWMSDQIEDYQKQCAIWKTPEIPTVTSDVPDYEDIPEQLQEIRDFVQEWKPRHVVYFLLSSGDVVYVGETQSLDARMRAHRKAGKVFDRVLYVQVSTKTALKVEAHFIFKLKPKYNGPQPWEAFKGS